MIECEAILNKYESIVKHWFKETNYRESFLKFIQNFSDFSVNLQCLLFYLTTPVWPSEAFQSMVLIHCPVWMSQNLRLQSSEPLMIRVSSNCRQVTASWWPWRVIRHSPVLFQTWHTNSKSCFRDKLEIIRVAVQSYWGGITNRLWGH